MWKQKNRMRGFTVIEITIFLGISALLLVVAFAGTGTSIASVRFGDSGKGLQSYVQSQYDQLQNGINSRSAEEACAASDVTEDAGSLANETGASNCLLLGRLVSFTNGTGEVKAYNVVGSEPATPNDNIVSYNPRLTPESTVQTFDIPWGATVYGTKRIGTNGAINSILFARSPLSGQLMTYSFNRLNTNDSDISSYITASNLSKEANICFRSAEIASRTSKIYLNKGSGQDVIDLIADPSPNECNGV